MSDCENNLGESNLREIDRLGESSLNEALRMLAEAGPREAPDPLEGTLKEAFRRHRRARQVQRALWGAIAAATAAACLFAIARVSFVRTPLVRAPVSSARVRPMTVPAAPAAPAQTVRARAKAPVRVAPVHKPTRRPPADQLATLDFVPLPYGDDALVDESATIVRVEMPRSALRLAGFNVAQERANERIQADVVLGADGLAHAVRFVRYTE
jgi:hypothetical protein